MELIYHKGVMAPRQLSQIIPGGLRRGRLYLNRSEKCTLAAPDYFVFISM
jgi:hypothetical protein